MTSPAAESVELGQLVGGRYEVVRDVGDPGGAHRFEAIVRGGDEALVLGRERVWLHVIGLASGAAAVRRIERGAKAMRTAAHDHVVDVLDVVDERGQCVLVSEPLGAPSLSQVLLSRGVLPIPIALEAAMQVSGALSAAEEVGVEARAVGPADVFLRGISVEEGEGAPTDWQRPKSLVLLHRPHANGRGGDANGGDAALVRVVAALLWAMLAGETPKTAEASDDVAAGLDVESLHALRELWDAPPLPDDVEALLVSLLAEDLPARPKSLGSVAASLRSIMARLAGSWEPPAPTTEKTHHAPDPSTERTPTHAHAPGDTLTAVREVEPAPEPTEPSPGAARPDAGSTEEDEDGVLPSEGGAPNAGTTMQSHRDAALDAPRARGARIQVLVRDAPPASSGETSAASSVKPSIPRSGAWNDDRVESKIWAIVALLAALAAIALGIVLGVR